MCEIKCYTFLKMILIYKIMNIFIVIFLLNICVNLLTNTHSHNLNTSNYITPVALNISVANVTGSLPLLMINKRQSYGIHVIHSQPILLSFSSKPKRNYIDRVSLTCNHIFFIFFLSTACSKKLKIRVNEFEMNNTVVIQQF